MAGGLRAIVLLLLMTSAFSVINEVRQLVAHGGLDVEISCYLNEEEYLLLGGLHVKWKWKSMNDTNWQPLPREAEIKNLEVAERNNMFEDEKEIVVSTIILSTVSVFQTGQYVCYLEELSYDLDETYLRVGYPPDIPARRLCETNGCLSSMTCYWDPGKDTYLPTTYQLFVAVELGILNWENHTQSASKDQATMTVERSYMFQHYLRVEAKNELASTTSDIWITIPHNTVKPDPPTNVTILNENRTAGATTCSMVVSWIAPERNTMLDLTYAVRRRKSNRGHSWQQYAMDSTTTVLTNLSPYTYYDIQVASMPSPSSFHSGYPSDWTAIISHRTELLPPFEPVNFKSVVAVKPSPGSNERWTVKADWPVYKGINQPGFYYDISYSMSNSDPVTRMMLRNNYTFFPTGKGKLTISGRHCNEVGCSEATPQHIDLNKALTPVEEIILSIKNSEAVVSWKVNEGNNVNRTCMVQLCSIKRASFLLHSEGDVVGKEENELCREVNVLCSSMEARVPVTPSPCRMYQAVVFRIFESGIYKIMTLSSPSLKQTVDPPVTTAGGFRAEDQSYMNVYRINTHWMWEESICRNLHDHLYLAVLFAPINGSECDSQNCPFEKPFYEPINSCSEAMTQHLVTTNLYGATLYDFELGYCCKALEDAPSICFQALGPTDYAGTPIGAPESPRNMGWKAGDPLQLHWSAPLHKNGPVDGYRIQYRKIKNSSSEIREEKNTFLELSSRYTQTELPIECESLDEETVYELRVTAYNIASGQFLYGPHIEEEAALCRFVNPDSIYDQSEYTSIVAGICSCFGFILITLAISYCQRNRLKKVVRKHVWPAVPGPDVLIHFSEGVDKNGNRYKNVYDDEKTYSNTTCYDSNRDGDDISCQEIPDNIPECARQSSSDSSNRYSIDGDEHILKDRYTTGKCGSLMKDEKIFAENILSCKDKNDDVFSPSSNLGGDTKADLFVDCSELSTATWRSVLYPRFSNGAKEAKGPRRSHSFSGSSGGSFNISSYVKNCSGGDDLRLLLSGNQPTIVQTPSTVKCTKISPNNKESSLLTTPNLCPKQKHPSSFCLGFNEPTSSCSVVRQKSSVGEHLRLCRGQSWYDGYSSYSANSTLPAGSVTLDSSSESKSSECSSPYVSISSVNRVVNVRGTTHDSTSDDSYILEGKLSDHSAAQTSVDSLELFYPASKSTDATPWDSCNQPHSSMSEWSPGGFMKTPLLECYSPPPVADTDPYITMNDALENSSPGRTSEPDPSTTPERHFHSKFDFQLEDESSSHSASASPYVLHVSPEKLSPQELTHTAFGPQINTIPFSRSPQTNIVGHG